jgi:hypothetical protein
MPSLPQPASPMVTGESRFSAWLIMPWKEIAAPSALPPAMGSGVTACKAGELSSNVFRSAS